MSEKNKLLLADDSITIQKVINLTFADEGIEVTAVGNGATAIERLPEVAPDLVLADVHMPGLNGYEVCERIRSTPGFENIPVMLLVGSFEPFDESEARRVGANDFLTKPFQSIKQLVTKVHSLLEDASNAANKQSEIAEEVDLLDDFRQTKTPFAVTGANALDRDLPQTNEQNFNFDDTAFDDRMIQTAPGGGFIQTIGDFDASSNREERENEWQVVEEDAAPPQEFDQAAYDAPTAELDINLIPQQSEENREPAETGDNFAETLKFERVEDEKAGEEMFDFPESNVGASSSYETDEEEPELNLTASEPQAEESKSPFAELFDDDDLLGIEEEVRAEIAKQDFAPSEGETPQEMTEAITPEIVSSETENQSREIAAVNPQTGIEKQGEYTALNFPPEVIDAIAQRVVEKLSDKVIEKIAWEIVPDRFDLIVRKTVQDKDRER